MNSGEPICQSSQILMTQRKFEQNSQSFLAMTTGTRISRIMKNGINKILLGWPHKIKITILSKAIPVCNRLTLTLYYKRYGKLRLSTISSMESVDNDDSGEATQNSKYLIEFEAKFEKLLDIEKMASVDERMEVKNLVGFSL
jgi:hypothetical protein